MRPSSAETSEPASRYRKMLSTKNRVSAPSSSRKYSAIVRPVRPTRARAPGGSFIWPNTSAVCGSTPASSISLYMSLPSRVLSPTPAKTERPLWWYAMFRMSSCTITVLPVPAPPNRPIFEPLANVQMRSMTLMPVSRISTFACCSDTGGAGRWMGQRVMPSGAGSSSMGAPITLNMRPSVSTPTGTEIGAPVATTLSPRRKPSVASMAMQRTTLSPIAPSTSSTTVRPSLIFTRRASNSSGWSPGGNSTSTTAPMTWLTLPSRVLLFVAAIDSPFLPLSGAHGLGAAHDFHQLRGDAGLADLVRVKRQRVDQVARGVGRVLHRDHLRRVLAGLVFQHGLEDLRLHVAGKQAVQDGLGVGLVDVVGARP